MQRVLIADEIYGRLKGEKSFLDRTGIRLFHADTNRNLLALHIRERADLIIAGLDSRDMSGEALCSVIREDENLRKVSIIIVCGAGDRDIERCSLCRANAFVSSPVSTAVLLQEAYQLLHIAPRRKARVPVSLKIEGISKGRPFVCEVRNISSSGVLLSTSAILYEGDEVRCGIRLADGFRISAAGEVVRVLGKKWGADRAYGIRFAELRQEDADALEAFLRKKPE